MAGGFWGKGNNPFFNYDYDSASRDNRMHRAELDSQQAQLDSASANDRVNRLRNQLNMTINSHANTVANYEQRIKDINNKFYKIAMQSNIFYRTLVRLQENFPEQKENILDEIQRQRDFCNQEEYQTKWWNGIHENKINDDYFEFPFKKRELKNKK